MKIYYNYTKLQSTCIAHRGGIVSDGMQMPTERKLARKKANIWDNAQNSLLLIPTFSRAEQNNTIQPKLCMFRILTAYSAIVIKHT